MKDHSSTSSSERRRFFGKAVLLATPFALAWAVELFFLPADAFTFRAAEAIGVHRLRTWFPGPFYPNTILDCADEHGDLAGPTRLAQHRRSLWVTNRYGFRHNDNLDLARPLAVALVGDSNIWESVLTQSDLVGERLERLMQKPVFPYATAMPDEFLSDSLSTQLSPKVVVFVLSERSVPSLSEPTVRPFDKPDLASRPIARRLSILADRALKVAMLRHYQAVFERAMERFYRRRVLGYDGNRLEPLGFSRIGQDGKTLFSAVELMMDRPDDASLARAARILGDYTQLFAARGTRFIFFPVPAKSTVEYALAGRSGPRDTLSRLKPFLAQENVEFIDTLPLYLARDSKGERLYEIDDNHWNAAGAKLAAEAMAEHLTGKSATKRSTH